MGLFLSGFLYCSCLISIHQSHLDRWGRFIVFLAFLEVSISQYSLREILFTIVRDMEYEGIWNDDLEKGRLKIFPAVHENVVC